MRIEFQKEFLEHGEMTTAQAAALLRLERTYPDDMDAMASREFCGFGAVMLDVRRNGARDIVLGIERDGYIHS